MTLQPPTTPRPPLQSWPTPSPTTPGPRWTVAADDHDRRLTGLQHLYLTTVALPYGHVERPARTAHGHGRPQHPTRLLRRPWRSRGDLRL
jgi:hypothetical protein